MAAERMHNLLLISRDAVIRPRNLAIAALLVLTVAAAVFIALLVDHSGSSGHLGPVTVSSQPSRPSGVDSGAGPGSGGRTNQSPTAAGSRGGNHHSRWHRLSRIYPGTILQNPEAVVSDEVMLPIVNGWTAQDHHGVTQVDAGRAADSKMTGLFAIYRERISPFDITTDVVRVPGSGAVTITRAPLGRNVVTSAQRHGNIEFRGASGVTGTLHLKDDSVTLNP